ncbi:hypothetical protein [Nocardia sp. NPDC058480]|uniref:hypothetical protein n=1 Tax=Nocardia sp. NPDC058480 TaxID=3346522 RepID=UPI003660F3CF
MPTPKQVLGWDVSGLSAVGVHATQIADQIIKTTGTAHTTVHGLAWQGDARRAAENKADREQTQMRAIATAYDDLGGACAGAANAMQFPLSEIKMIFQHYVVAPVAVADDWTVTGVEDWDSEAGIQLQRLSGLADSLLTADALWGGKIATANAELAAMAPADALQKANSEIQQYRSKDGRSDPDRMRTSAAAFQQAFGRLPATAVDWTTAEALNPNSYDPKYKGVDPEVRAVKIEPRPGQGVVRTAQYIQERDDLDPSMDNPFSGRNKGDDRTADADFDPEHARVTTYVDYENGIVVMRQNPSVVQEADGSSGHVETGKPTGEVIQAADGSVRVKYEAADPIGMGGPMQQFGWSVNGDLVFTPSSDGIHIDGTRTNYPWMEAYQTRPDGSDRTIAVDPPTGVGTGTSMGPAANLQGHHELGTGGRALDDDRWKGWNSQYDVKVDRSGTPFGTTGHAPTVTAPPRRTHEA